MFETNIKDIQAVITDYFEGVFYGNIQKLESAFHPKCLLIGDINGNPYFKNREEYLEGVKTRKSPNELGESFDMKIIGIETLGNNALAKVHLPMLGYNYYDFLSLSKIDGQWIIVNKVFSNIQK